MGMIGLLLPLLLAAGQEPAHFPYQRWEAGDGSRAGFDGDSTLHAFSGECTRLSAALHADLDRLAATGGGEVAFLVADLSTGKDDRDANMLEDLAADRFPRIVFRLDTLSGALAAAGSSNLEAMGAFTIRGVERARAFPVQIERLPGGRLAARGELRFLQTDHGIEPHSTLGLVKVHDEVRVWFDLQLQPVAAAERPGRMNAVRCTETVRIPGAPPATASAAWQLWSAGDAALLIGSGEWWLADAAGAGLRVDARRGRQLAAGAAVETAFAEARARLESFQRRLAALSPEQRAQAGTKLEETIARLQATLAEAPPPGPVEVKRAGDQVELLLGGTAWAVLQGLDGDAPVPAALAAMPDLPAAIRAGLSQLRGTPARVQLRAATPAGTREYVLELATGSEAVIPAWALDPAAWPPPETASAH